MSNLFNPNHKFNMYARQHRDGDWMLMIQNQHTCRCLFKSSSMDRVIYWHDRIDKECGMRDKFSVLLRYYKLAKGLGIYQTTLI